MARKTLRNISEIRRHFQEDWLARTLSRTARHQQSFERCLVLQAAQARCIGRGNIDRDIVRMGRNGLDTAHIIRNSVVTLLVRPDIRAEWHGTGIHFEVRDEIVETCIVEPHPVDDGLVSA